jgi:LysR family nitrogen assimilation transcriptional regulator
MKIYPELSVDLRKLRYFVEVVEQGGFTRSAARLNVAQSAVSRQIRLLEEELGVELIVRDIGGIRLTPQGTIFLEHARRILRNVQEAIQAVSSRTKERLTLRLGAPPSLANYVFGPLGAIYADRQDVRLISTDLWSCDVAEWLHSERVHVAVSTYLTGSIEVVHTPIMSEELYLICKPGNALLDQIHEFSDLDNVPLITMSAKHGQRLWLEQLAVRHNIDLRVTIEAESLGGIRDMLLRGMGVAIQPIGSFYDDIRTGQLSAARIPDTNVTRYICLAAGRLQTPLLDELVENVRREILQLSFKSVSDDPAPTQS